VAAGAAVQAGIFEGQVRVVQRWPCSLQVAFVKLVAGQLGWPLHGLSVWLGRCPAISRRPHGHPHSRRVSTTAIAACCMPVPLPPPSRRFQS
jgi:hypothetical protein